MAAVPMGFNRREMLGTASRGVLAWLAAGVAAASGRSSVVAADRDDANPEVRNPALRVPSEARTAIESGLKFLVARQNDDGSFGEGLYSRNVGVCSLAGMALMAQGSTPRRGTYGAAVQRVVDLVLGSCQESGYITQAAAVSHGPMYEHGFATVLLAETYGMTNAPQLREKLSRAVRLIVDKQNSEGGWRYFPERRDADISVTIAQVTALRAARNAAIHVPAATIDRAIDYIKRCQNPDGGFMYMLQSGGASRFPRSAAAVVALYNAGIFEGPELTRGLDYLMQFRPTAGAPAADAESYYFYGHYYAAQAMWQAGGEYWKKWYPSVVKEIVAQQRGDGSWPDTISPMYGTAMACLVLGMPHNHLSIFQK